jgi:hypothetical protein
MCHSFEDVRASLPKRLVGERKTKDSAFHNYICVENTRSLSDLFTVELGCCFPSSSSSILVSRAAVGNAPLLYPLAQAAFNLRFLWLQWSSLMARTGDAEQEILCTTIDLCSAAPVMCNEPKDAVLSWLKGWAEKRRNASLEKRRNAFSSGQTKVSLGGKIGCGTTTNSYAEEEEEFSDEGFSDGYSDSDVDAEELSNSPMLANVLILEGPSGCGKSDTVYSCTKVLGFKVIEVNTSQTRSSSVIKKLILEAAQSLNVLDSAAGTTSLVSTSSSKIGRTAQCKKAELSLIFFDEVNVLLIFFCSFFILRIKAYVLFCRLTSFLTTKIFMVLLCSWLKYQNALLSSHQSVQFHFLKI